MGKKTFQGFHGSTFTVSRRGNLKGSTPMVVAKRADRKANMLMKTVKDKYWDENVGATNADYNGTLVLINDPTQGSGVTNREGDEIFCKAFKMALQITLGSSGNASTFRVIVIWDQDMTISNANQILSTIGSVSSVTSQNNFEWRKNYRLLFDRTYALDSTDKSTYTIKRTIKLNKSTVFSGAGGATVRKGGLRVLLISNIAPASADRPAYIYNFRTLFTD